MSSTQPTVLGRPCGPLGFGLMGLTWRANPKPFEECIPVMKRALELGADNWNGGELYGIPDRNSMHLLREYFTKYPEDADKVILCIKGGTERGTLIPNSSEENIRRSVDDCLAVIQGTSKSKIDIFECARVDHSRGSEPALRTLASYVKDGKIGAIGLSEVSAKTIRESQKMVKEFGVSAGVASVEVELSLWTPDILHNGVLAACAEENIPVFAYSPLARGAFSDNPFRKNADIPEGDFRKMLPRYQDDALAVNNQIVDAVADMARAKNATTPQIAIAWVRGQSGRTRTLGLGDGSSKTMKLPVIIPIPGASSIERVEENFKQVVLSEEEMQALDALVEKFPVQGDRYHAQGMAHVNG